jgi:hypothetical protein
VLNRGETDLILKNPHAYNSRGNGDNRSEAVKSPRCKQEEIASLKGKICPVRQIDTTIFPEIERKVAIEERIE